MHLLKGCAELAVSFARRLSIGDVKAEPDDKAQPAQHRKLQVSEWPKEGGSIDAALALFF